jgi:hypothetical protein
VSIETVPLNFSDASSASSVAIGCRVHWGSSAVASSRTIGRVVAELNSAGRACPKIAVARRVQRFTRHGFFQIRRHVHRLPIS